MAHFQTALILIPLLLYAVARLAEDEARHHHWRGLWQRFITLRTVWRNGIRDLSHPPLATRTAYPYGGSDYSVTTDPLGNRTTNSIQRTAAYEQTFTRAPGLTTITTRHRDRRTGPDR